MSTPDGCPCRQQEIDDRNRRLRGWAYRILLAAGPLVTYYGLASKQDVAVWTAAIAMALGHGLASKHTPVRRRNDRRRRP